MSTSKMLHIGMIGTGSISDLHMRCYAKNENAVIYAICDLNEQRAAAAAQKYDAQSVYTDYREMLKDPHVDAVSICTWNNTHAEFAIAALEAGKHVLLEKPVATNVEDALRIEEAVKKSGCTFIVGFVRRYDNNMQMLRRFIDAGEFGQLYYAKASILRRLGNPGGWFADKNRSGGGPLIDLGVHIIDQCWYLMGRPKPVAVSGNTYRKLGNRAHIEELSFYKAADYSSAVNNVEDMANALIRFENGASLAVDVSFTLHARGEESYVKLYGERGGFEVEPETLIITEKHNTILNIEPQTDHTGLHIHSAFQNQIDHFVDCCLNGTGPISPIADGVASTKMLCGIYESAEKGQEIRLD
ncbi:Gfo/Idh/MocA family oxidoreductase [Paenibacillus pabuli]|uniref:Gfo/Idh/MocA family protein n=1 Tax=Paenibacillus pabuli TaxID=1472 RepID=UPI003241D82D